MTTFITIIGGGFRDYGARGRNHLYGPCLKIFVNQDYSSSSFSLKLLCLKGVFKCFPVISFKFLVGCGAPSGLPKARGLGPWPPGPPLKPPLTIIAKRSHLLPQALILLSFPSFFDVNEIGCDFPPQTTTKSFFFDSKLKQVLQCDFRTFLVLIGSFLAC